MIRRATAEDAAAIAEVQVRSWHHAYADIVAPEQLAEHTVASRTECWRGLLAAGESTTLVAGVEGTVAGFASITLDEVLALCVDPPAQGAGVGRALLGAAEDGMRAAGSAEAVLWVFEANARARSFCEAHGWAPEEPPVVRDNPWAPELRYRRDLVP